MLRNGSVAASWGLLLWLYGVSISHQEMSTLNWQSTSTFGESSQNLCPLSENLFKNLLGFNAHEAPQGNKHPCLACEQPCTLKPLGDLGTTQRAPANHQGTASMLSARYCQIQDNSQNAVRPSTAHSRGFRRTAKMLGKIPSPKC